MRYLLRLNTQNILLMLVHVDLHFHPALRLDKSLVRFLSSSSPRFMHDARLSHRQYFHLFSFFIVFAMRKPETDLQVRCIQIAHLHWH